MYRLDHSAVVTRASTIVNPVTVVMSPQVFALALALSSLLQSEHWLWVERTEATKDLTDALQGALQDAL